MRFIIILFLSNRRQDACVPIEADTVLTAQNVAVGGSGDSDLWNQTYDYETPEDNNRLIISEFNDDYSCDSENGHSGGKWIDSDAKFYISGNAALIEDAGSTASEWAYDGLLIIRDGKIFNATGEEIR
jgi:hypothetical protein